MIDPEPQVFYPARFPGFLFQGLFLLLLAFSTAFFLWQAANASFGFSFFVALLPVILTFLLAPIILYRIQSLRRSAYILERDGIQLYWGLRVEHIPMNEVLYVRSLQEFGRPVPLPWMRWPGSVVGQTQMSDGTAVEFLASSAAGLILLVTSSRIFAISPEEPAAFLEAYYRIMELGSLSPIAPQSVYPSFLSGRFWADRPARVMLATGAVVCLVILVWVSLVIPTRTEIHLRPMIDGTGKVPPVRMLLLPFLSAAFFVGDLLSGLYFYRRAENQPAGQGYDTALAYLLWGSGALVPLLFLGAVVFILKSG
jgi:hypothetical protein